jgi:hypothetical protein
MALGASRRDVLRLILGDGLRMTLIGVGLGHHSGLTRLLFRITYGVSETDSLTLVGVAIFLTAVALFACHVPARKPLASTPWWCCVMNGSLACRNGILVSSPSFAAMVGFGIYHCLGIFTKEAFRADTEGHPISLRVLSTSSRRISSARLTPALPPAARP